VTGADVAGSTTTMRRMIRRTTTRWRDGCAALGDAARSGIGAAPWAPTPVANVAIPVVQASARMRLGLQRRLRGRSVVVIVILVFVFVVRGLVLV
jgi:hypothetical protein